MLGLKLNYVSKSGHWGYHRLSLSYRFELIVVLQITMPVTLLGRIRSYLIKTNLLKKIAVRNRVVTGKFCVKHLSVATTNNPIYGLHINRLETPNDKPLYLKTLKSTHVIAMVWSLACGFVGYSTWVTKNPLFKVRYLAQMERPKVCTVAALKICQYSAYRWPFLTSECCNTGWLSPVRRRANTTGKKLEKLERLRSENTPAVPWLPILVFISDLNLKKTQSKWQILKKMPKKQILEFCKQLYTWYIFWNCLIWCVNIRLELWKLQTDRQTDGRTDDFKPVYPSVNFFESGV